MKNILIERDFDSFRAAARSLLAARVHPNEVTWTDSTEPSLLQSEVVAPTDHAVRVSPKFFSLCQLASCHRDESRWRLMYRLLWRLSHGEPHLLDVVVDKDVHRVTTMEKAVRRDRHKMTAFVRFRRVEKDGEEHFIAWHRPDHYIVRLTAPFFRDRFAVMKWIILTPDDSASWDGHQLCFGPGVPASEAPQADALEELWTTYYASIFNPARIKLNAMRKEMPKKHWPTLPETKLIPEMLRDAPRRVEEMVMNARPKTATASSEFTSLDKCKNTGSAAAFLPSKLTLPQLRKAAEACRGCDLYCNATQVVFGEGSAEAFVMFIGEQPGDQEDRQGKPFVGPAGQLLDQVLEEVGIDRQRDVYVTNAVKHFKWEPRGKMRLHSKPNAREMAACRPWVEAEIAVIKPQMIVCLGATAAQSLLGAGFRITKSRGEIMTDTKWSPWVMATYHPSALLRMPDEDARHEARKQFTEDLQAVAKQIAAVKSHRGATEKHVEKWTAQHGDEVRDSVISQRDARCST